ncbi:MAG: VanW family protein [Candidatus Gracilibacteria bacterium]
MGKKSEKSKIAHPKTPSSKKGLFLLGGLLVGVIATVIGVQVALNGKVAPHTSMFGQDISLAQAEDVQQTLSEKLDAYEQAPINLIFEGTSYTFTLAELGITLNKTASVESIPVMNWFTSFTSFEGGLLGQKEVAVVYEYDDEILRNALNARIINLTVAAQEPRVSYNPYTDSFDISLESNGWTADMGQFYENMDSLIKNLDSSPVEIATVELFPNITAAELESQKDLLKNTLNQTVTLYTTTNSWDIYWLDHLDWLSFTPKEKVKSTAPKAVDATDTPDGQTLISAPEIQVQVDPAAIETYVRDTIAPDVETASQDVTILMDENGAITFEGTAVDGLAIQYENLNDFLNLALDQGLSSVELPIQVTKGKVNAPEELRAQGITELVATGYSAYNGSPTNRIHNIGVGIERFNGVLIQPGEEFTFGDQLGPVDGSTGYLKELVIKEGKTVPEYGGGICQVSSTLYRAVLFTGLPVIERHAHAYAVKYYAYPLGWGLDATVYPPTVDLVFKNDMATPILIQSYVDWGEAYFKFYGTKDGRSVTMDGPYITNQAGAPAPQYTVTPDLAPGEIEQVDTAHAGFTATWIQTILYADGTSVTNQIVSPYHPWAAKYMVGEGTPGYGDTPSEDAATTVAE